MNKQFQLVFRNNAGKKLADYLMLISVLGGIVMVFRILAAVLFVAGIFGGILFSSAGRLDWPEAWMVTILYAGYLLASMIWGSFHASELMRERSRMAMNVKSWDKRVNLLVVVLLVALLIVAGLDTRYGWSSIPVVLKWLGAFGMIGAGYITWLTMRENPFLSRWARIQDDRGQTVVSSGPYRHVRHPMYASIMVYVFSMTLLLDSMWALIPAGMVILGYLTRTYLEDRMLQKELPDYKEYTVRVQYRLIPWIW